MQQSVIRGRVPGIGSICLDLFGGRRASVPAGSAAGMAAKLSALAVAALVCAAAAMAVLSWPIAARDSDETCIAGDVIFENPTATPAKAGGTSRITLSIDNSGSEPVVVLGLRLPGSDGAQARIVGAVGGHMVSEMSSVSVRAGEVEVFDGKSRWLEIGPLAQELPDGARIDAFLLTARGELPLTLRVRVLFEPRRPAAASSRVGRLT